ncbi:helix-turn-helix transcriptional regulator [Actinokineospora sp. HUAS TT18]|uniref:helix-turn-helix transcriptional regulator n=1 Tax=Actinokineospora sp. HUAS TT18 TaxID=3447451 RepID=UPI003F52491D
MTGLLERDDLVDCVQQALDSAAAGVGRFVVVEGPPGIGKTALVDEARVLAKGRGFARVTATADEAERELPWGIVRQLVERSVARFTGQTRDLVLSGPAGAALAAIDRAETSGQDAATQLRTRHALWWVVADLVADRPMLITVDDLQWADAPSLGFIGYLARRLADLPVALVVGTRPPTSGDGVLAELASARVGELLRPAPLSASAIAALAGAVPAPAVVSALHESSGGNPFLARQVLAELMAQGRSPADPASADVVATLGPRSVSRALLARLSPPARSVAAAAAILGVRCDPDQAARLADVPDPAEATAELARAYVLVGSGFTHPVIREAVLADLLPGDRADLHARAAADLLRTGASAPRVAAHLAEAPHRLDGAAATVLAEAGRTVLADGMGETAARYLRLAASAGAPDVRADLGSALLTAGRFAEARTELTAAADADPDRAGALLAQAAVATMRLDGHAAAITWLRSTLADFTGDPLPMEARLGLFSAYVPDEFERSGRRLRRFADLPGDTPTERFLLALVAQRAFAEVWPAAEVRELVPRALCLDLLRLDEHEGAVAWGSALHALIMADGVDAAAAEIDRARAAFLPDGSPLDYAIVSVVAAVLAWRAGDVRACGTEVAAATGALALADPGPMASALTAVITRFGVLAAIERADLTEARAVLAAHDHTGPMTVPANRVGHARAYLALAEGDAATALKAALALGAAEQVAGGDNPAVEWRAQAALAHLRLGETASAQALAEEQHELALRWGASTEIGAALRVRARVGGPDERVTLLEQAHEVLAESPCALERARTQRDLGEALRVAGRRSDARAHLVHAAESATEIGAVRLRTGIIDALDRLGDRPRELATAGADALTPSERRIATLACAGRSNREIAQEIFVTPKTVENHLGRIYHKLGIRNRRELGATLNA